MERSFQTLMEGFRSFVASRRRFLLVTGSLLALALLVLITTSKESKLTQLPRSAEPQSTAAFPPASPDARIDLSKETKTVAPMPSASYGGRFNELSESSSEPRVTYSAELAVATKEFSRARSSMEEILDRHRGYTAKLRMVGQLSGSTLSATLRVPASEYSSTLAELKSVGNIERDEEAADEIVQQHGALEARLQNAQNAERHLQELLKDNSNKYSNPLPIEQQLAQLRIEIDRMQAERRTFDNRTVFSNIYFSLREEHTAPAETFSAQLRNATVSGLSDAFRTISAILLFCVNYGPSLLLWAIILFFPVRMLWRRSRTTMVRDPA